MTTDIVPAANIAALDTLDTEARELAITGMLDNARAWLAHAVESTAPAQEISEFKAFIATAAETAKRLKVSREIQQDAEVMVRRTERALGQAIRTGQQHGEILRNGQAATFSPGEKLSPRHFLPGGKTMTETYALTDDVTDDQFEEAIDRAQEENNVSRANVVRKVEEVKTGAERQQEKWDRVAEMATQGYTTPQIAREVEMSEGGVKAGAKQRGIDIRADRIVGRSHRLDMRRVISQTVSELESIASTTAGLVSVEGIIAADITPEEIQEWIDSLTNSLTDLRKATNQIAKAATQIKESNS